MSAGTGEGAIHPEIDRFVVERGGPDRDSEATEAMTREEARAAALHVMGGKAWEPFPGTRTRRNVAAQAARNALQDYRRNPDNNESLLRALRALAEVMTDQSHGTDNLRWWT